MKSFGQSIQKLREAKGEPILTTAGYLGINTSILGKIERGEQKANREQVEKLADYFNEDKNNLLLQWLADEDYKVEDMEFTEPHIAEGIATYSTPAKKIIISRLKAFFANDGRIDDAWIFGSFARGDDTVKSDIDLMVKFCENRKVSLFDLADITFLLEQKTKRKIDLVEKGCMQPFALKTAQKDLFKIYG